MLCHLRYNSCVLVRWCAMIAPIAENLIRRDFSLHEANYAEKEASLTASRYPPAVERLRSIAGARRFPQAHQMAVDEIAERTSHPEFSAQISQTTGPDASIVIARHCGPMVSPAPPKTSALGIVGDTREKA